MLKNPEKTERENVWTGEQDGYVTLSNRYLSALSSLSDRHAQHFSSVVRTLSDEKTRTPQLIDKAYEDMQRAKEGIKDPDLRIYFQALIIEPLQVIMRKPGIQRTPPDTVRNLKGTLSAINKSNASMQIKIQMMRDGLTKGAPTGQISPHSQLIKIALEKAIVKLATLNQPLRNRPDYGTTVDIAERLKKFKDEELDAAMYKQLELPHPKPVAIDYDDPELSIKSCRSTCPHCHGFHREPVLSHCMDSRFKRIRGMLKGRGEVTLSGVEIKTILSALDDIHQKYRELEDR